MNIKAIYIVSEISILQRASYLVANKKDILSYFLTGW